MRAPAAIAGDAVPEPVRRALRPLATLPHRTVLLAGPEGGGQVEAARWYAMVANCVTGAPEPCGRCGSCTSFVSDETGAVLGDDYRELRPAEQTRDGRSARRPLIGIDQLVPRQRGDPDPLGPWLHAPPRARRRVGVVVRADALTEEASNAFLKTLEEPPATSTVILIAPGRDALIPTVASRCLVLRFPPPPTAPPPAETQRAVESLFDALARGLHATFEATAVLQRQWQPGDVTTPDALRDAARARGPSAYLAVDAAVTAAEDALAAYAHRDLTMKRLALELRRALHGPG